LIADESKSIISRPREWPSLDGARQKWWQYYQRRTNKMGHQSFPAEANQLQRDWNPGSSWRPPCSGYFLFEV